MNEEQPWLTGVPLELLLQAEAIKAGDEVMLEGDPQLYVLQETHRDRFGNACDDDRPYRLRLPAMNEGDWPRYPVIVAWRRPVKS